MKSKELITVRDEEKEILHFLGRIRAFGSAVIQHGSDRFVIDIRRDEVSEKGRHILTKGGPLDEE